MASARVVRFARVGGPEVLEIADVERPAPGPSQILVEVEAAGLNRADVLQRRGLYPAPPGSPPDVPGLEYAGRVAALGEGVRDFAVNDRVMGIVGGGAMATHLVVHEREAMHVPGAVSTALAAAIPEAFLTAFDALQMQAEFRFGESVLVHAAASGVGTAAIQLARLGGALVLGTSRSEEKLARCTELGLQVPLLVAPGTSHFAAHVRAHSGRGADVILDLVGGAYLEENLDALALGGRLVVLGLLGGPGASLPLAKVLQKRLRVMGSVLRSRPLEEKASLAQAFSQRVLPFFAPRGPLAPVVCAEVPMREIADAHARMERNDTFGKIVLVW